MAIPIGTSVYGCVFPRYTPSVSPTHRFAVSTPGAEWVAAVKERHG
jgi:hypothetical protein